MSRLPSSNEIIKFLTDNDFKFISQKGSHKKFRKNGFTVIVPDPKKEIPMGTFASIKRESGLNWDEFDG